MRNPLLEVQQLNVVHGRGRKSVRAVRDVDLTVPRQQTVGVVGESGSGKSTLGNAILGLVPVQAGKVLFDGTDITRVQPAQRRNLARRIQVIFQDPYGSLNPARSIGDTLSEGLRFAHGTTRSVADAQVADVLDEVGLDASAARRFPGSFSGGQRQRIAIARAIIGDPDLVVCDEPVSALDLSVQAQVLNLLARLKSERGLSYLFISHDLGVVRYLSDEIVVMHAGRIVERGAAAAIADAPVHPYTRALVAAAPVPDPEEQRRNRTARLAAQRSAAGAPAAARGCSFAGRCAFATDVCRTVVPALTLTDVGHPVACHHHEALRVTTPSAAELATSAPRTES